MKYNKIKHLGKSDYVNMGPIRLRQPIPTKEIKQIDPYLLLHHYGPFEINSKQNPFDLGPHPHRGFEPITFLIQGEQLHRDSLGNESIVKAGDVQWTTSGKGIIHAEGPSQSFVEKGGTLEGIQLWLNLPSHKKMMEPNYQHITSNEFHSFKINDNSFLNIIAGNFKDLKGKITTQTEVDVYWIELEDTALTFNLKMNYNSLLYLVEGEAVINESENLKINENQLVYFEEEGKEIKIQSKGKSKLLFLAGEPINEKVANWGPYVMNTQNELIQAVRSYEMGEFGVLQ